MADQFELDPLHKLQEGPETTETPRAVGHERPQKVDKDAIFTSEEAEDFDVGQVGRYDNFGSAEMSDVEGKVVPNVPSTDDYH